MQRILADVTLSSLSLVTGDLALETNDSDALSVAPSVSGGSTDIANTRDDSLISLALPFGTLGQNKAQVPQRFATAAFSWQRAPATTSSTLQTCRT